jgi:hypothetical protein
LNNSTYQRLKEKAGRTAERLGLPSFYNLHKKELDRSFRSYSHSEILRKCREHIDESKLHPAHGMSHCEKVAIEAGAILSIEGERTGYSGPDIEKLMLCVQIAGLLHDIKRTENNHTLAGSIEAGKILSFFDINSNHKRYITAAIENHEAFKPLLDSQDESARLISNSLYDADKFRWGPDNFTVTLWLIIESADMPAEILYTSFREKMEWIRRIKDTFRTETGKKYGPEFIDFGIEIGKEIYSEMECIIGD